MGRYSWKVTGPNEAVRALSAALRELHRVLVRIEQQAYQTQRGSFAKPAGLLELLIHDPHFAWLRGISETIVVLDELVADPDVDPDAIASQARTAVERLFGKAGTGGTPEPRLVEVIQQEPAVAIAFSDVNARANELG